MIYFVNQVDLTKKLEAAYKQLKKDYKRAESKVLRCRKKLLKPRIMSDAVLYKNAYDAKVEAEHLLNDLETTKDHLESKLNVLHNLNPIILGYDEYSGGYDKDIFIFIAEFVECMVFRFVADAECSVTSEYKMSIGYRERNNNENWVVVCSLKDEDGYILPPFEDWSARRYMCGRDLIKTIVFAHRMDVEFDHE